MSHYPNVCGYRRPRTTQEMRENDAILYEKVESPVKVRASRTKYKLPSENDERPTADKKNRNWKKNRHQRYRRVAT